ncbi:MAG: SUMF1/EgtB/PvdO family nonheme iron enzyme, partial [bacterium]|nr:SUMF1/EgtB/PvdO family nonheme iron enzyme [bacterium]
MAIIYISSTYKDLIKEREAAAKAVRRLGHHTIAMEDYVASDQRPVEKCLQDVRSSDVYIGIFAWRYGYIPPGYDKSITHLEYDTARKAGIPCLIFLLDEKAKWPRDQMDKGDNEHKIDKLRDELKKDHVVSFFTNADDLGGVVSAAVSNLVLVNGTASIKLKNPEQLTGTRFGKYVLGEKLGRGGKGVVLKAMDTLEGIPKAVKMIPLQISDSPVAFKELKLEVNNALRVSHPNVVKVLGLEKQEEQYFIVMEYIEGHSLEQILADSDHGKLNEPEVLEIMKKMARGLDETHKNRVIHRDIKPSNVMVTIGGQVKILDFGISYQVTKSMTQLVGEDQRTGTWPYMAPEQLSTRFGRENEQVDIWGFGVTMYQLLTGQLPFHYKEQIKDKNEKPFEMEGISKRSRDIVMKCLEKDRKKRFKNMAEVLAAFIELEAVSKQSRDTGIKEPVEGSREFRETDYGDGIVMVYIPPGKFTMGSNDYSSEKPPHEVELDGYWMGKYQVTVKQYMQFADDTKANYPEWMEKGSQYNIETGNDNHYKKLGAALKGDNFPIIGVSWHNASAYCEWLSKKTGVTFKLPTEAQWEKAARGTDGLKYPWGEQVPSKNLANFSSNIGKTSPVGSYPNGASPYGLLDMAGNVWEWCGDWYAGYSSEPQKNPTGPASGS